MRIPGDAGAVAAAAGRVDGVARAIAEDRRTLDRQAAGLTAPGRWNGAGAAAFRADAGDLGAIADTLTGACQAVGATLRAYATALAAVQADAAQLDREAAAARFVVDDDGGVRYTGPPVIVDPARPDHGIAADQVRLEGEARALLARADEAAETARRQVDDARMALVGDYEPAPPWASPFGTAGYLYTAYTSAGSAYALTRTDLGRLEGPRDFILRKLDRASSPKRLRHWEKELARYDREVPSELRANLRGTMDAADTWSRRLPLSRTLSYSLGDLSESAGPLSRTLGSRALRNVPLVGIGLTAWQAESNIAGGAEPTEEVTADATSLVAGAVVADAAVGLAVGLGLTAGAPIVIGLAAGALAAYGVGEGVHWFFHTEVGHDVAQTVDHAVGSAVDAVGDAGHAIGGAVSKGWHSVFG